MDSINPTTTTNLLYAKDKFLSCLWWKFYDTNKLYGSKNLILFFLLLQKGEVNLENVTHEEAVATLKTTQDRVVLVVAKPESAFIAPASETSYSPQLCECFLIFLKCAYSFKSSTGII